MHEKRFTAGMTSVEIIVVTSIIMMISSIVVVSFTSLNESVALRRSRFEFSLAVRQAQNYALSVIPIGGVVASLYGVHLTQGNSTYFLFADTNGNNVYDGGDLKIGFDRIFPRGIRVGILTPQILPAPAVADIVFASPEADVRLRNSLNQADLGENLLITLQNTAGTMSSRVRVRISGQISWE